jgi:aldose 1-epimerase
MIAPSGEQITITLGDQQAVIVEVGGGLRSYSAGGRELVDGYGARLEGGSYEFDGKHHQLPLNEPECRNAIHGLVRWMTWSVAEREAHRVVMQHVLYPQPGYPFLLRTSIEYVLSDSLLVRTTTTNLGSERCPYGRRSSLSNTRNCDH